MTTAREIITSAYKRVGIAEKDEQLEADYADYGLDALNEMMHGWKARSADTTHTTLALSDDFPLAAEYEGPTITLLANRVSSDYGVQPPPPIQVKDAWDIIAAAFFVMTEATFDDGLLNMPSQAGRYRLF